MTWASPFHITLAIWVRVRVRFPGDAHISRVLGIGTPKTQGCPYQCDIDSKSSAVFSCVAVVSALFNEAEVAQGGIGKGRKKVSKNDCYAGYAAQGHVSLPPFPLELYISDIYGLENALNHRKISMGTVLDSTNFTFSHSFPLN